MKNLLLHFINELDNSTGFEIMHFERMEMPNIEPSHKHTFYEILCTEKGTSKQIINYKEYKIVPNSLFFISPD
ncbi:AraC-like protein [Flavobacteriaceae bacterium MAR_2009_75]|nr:AraC-like protein [Flavobacteriaceae bacterium MAR_2009_75]